MSDKMPAEGGHVFISYLHADKDVVDRLCQDLRASGVHVWLDSTNIVPGQRWPDAIRTAIQEGSYFIACFSDEYHRRSQTYQNEELTEAIEILRQSPTSRIWFLPVRLTDCDIPDRTIGGGETLRNLQRVDLFKDWQRGIDQILSVIQPPKKKLSDDLSFAIAMFNEEGVIGPTLSQLISKRYHQRYNVIVCDDDSKDRSLEEARANAERHESICVIENRPNGRKVGAIRAALQHVHTPYVFLMDADSMVHEMSPGLLNTLVEEMKSNGLIAIGFKIRPRANRLVEKLQRLEYLLFTDSIRRLLGVVVCLVGQGVLWETETLKKVLSRHSGIFEGDDLEATMLAALMEGADGQIAYEGKRVWVTTTPKHTWAALLLQRIRIWDVGLIHSFLDTPGIFVGRGRNVTFLRSIFAADVLAHFFKVIAFPPLCLLILYALIGIFRHGNSVIWNTASLLYKASIVSLKTLVWIGDGYMLLWLVTIFSIFYGLLPSMKRAVGMSIFFTLYMATPWFVFWAPSVSSVFTNANDALGRAYWWLGPVLSLTYLWWCLIAVVLLLFGSEDKWSKIRLIPLALLMPIYCLIVLVVARTIGFLWYFTGRIHGLYKPIKPA